MQATAVCAASSMGLGYRLDGADYGLSLPAGADGSEEAQRVAARHAELLGYRAVRFDMDVDGQAAHLARLALILESLALGTAPGTEDRDDLQKAWFMATARGRDDAELVTVHADGSYDQQDLSLSAGYTLNGRPYAVSFQVAGPVNGALAEREAIRIALTHARLLGFARLEVRSDHVFHVRRYAEDLVHRGRRKSPSLERLDALVEELGSAVSFQYVRTEDHHAPHRMAVHARALRRLGRGLPLSRAQISALRRVHFALRSPVPVAY